MRLNFQNSVGHGRETKRFNRSYFYAYYSYWGDWWREVPNLSRHAYRLKRLVTLEQSIFHAIFARFYRGESLARLGEKETVKACREEPLKKSCKSTENG